MLVLYFHLFIYFSLFYVHALEHDAASLNYQKLRNFDILDSKLFSWCDLSERNDETHFYLFVCFLNDRTKNVHHMVQPSSWSLAFLKVSFDFAF